MQPGAAARLRSILFIKNPLPLGEGRVRPLFRQNKFAMNLFGEDLWLITDRRWAYVLHPIFTTHWTKSMPSPARWRASGINPDVCSQTQFKQLGTNCRIF